MKGALLSFVLLEMDTIPLSQHIPLDAKLDARVLDSPESFKFIYQR